MITYEKLLQKPQVAKSLIGMALVEFDKFYVEFETAHTERLQTSATTRGKRKKRQRAVGAGRKHKYALRDRLLMTWFWLKAYTTYELLGFFYDLNKTNIEDNLKLVLDTLASMTSFNFDHPKADRQKLSSVAEVMDAFPDVRLIIDAKEQRIERPKYKTIKRATCRIVKSRTIQASRKRIRSKIRRAFLRQVWLSMLRKVCQAAQLMI